MLKLGPTPRSRVRRLAQKAFTPKIVNQLEPQVKGRCGALIDAFILDGRCDYARRFSAVLPVQVVADLTGVPLDLAGAFTLCGEDYVLLIGGSRH